MLQHEKCVATLFLLMYFYNGVSAAYFKMLRMKVDPLASQLSFNSNREYVFYVTCNKIFSLGRSLRAENRSVTCNFNLQTRTTKFAYVKSCYNILMKYLGLFTKYQPQFIDDRNILIQYSVTTLKFNGTAEQKVRYKVFNFTDCSFATSLEIPFGEEIDDFMYVSVTNDTIDLFVMNAALCNKNNKMCQISYNLQGKQLGDPKLFPPGEVYHTALVNNQESEKGRYLNRREGDNWMISHINSTGQENILKSILIFNTTWSNGFHETEYSNSHELYSFCTPNVQDHLRVNGEYQAIDITCMQFDTKGMMWNASLQIAKNTVAIAIHNLPTNEILLATGNVEENKEPTAVISSINIFKISKNGSSFNSLLIENLNLKHRFPDNSMPTGIDLEFVKMRIYERSKDIICVHIACLSPSDTPRGLQYGPLQYNVKCISKKRLQNLDYI